MQCSDPRTESRTTDYSTSITRKNMASGHPSAWTDGDIQREQDSPIPPYSTCVASRSFRGKEAHDLPFVKGEVLTIIEPCNVVFWYLAENKDGKRGIIPITHVKVQSLIPQAHRQSFYPPPIPPKATEPRKQAPSPLHTSHPPTSSHPPSPSHPPTSLPQAPSPLHTSHPPTSSHPPSPSHSPTTIPPPPLHPKPSSKPSSRSPSHQLTSTPPPTPHKPLLPPKPVKVQLSKTLPRQLQRIHPQSLARSTSTDTSMPHPPHGETPPISHSPSIKAAPPIPPERSHQVDIDSRPPAPLPQEATPKRQEPVATHRPGRYRTKDEFLNKSGWFAPTVDNCLCLKTNMQMTAFRAVKHGIYYFQHKRQQKLKYVGRSHHVYEALITMYHRLFELPDRSLSPLEVELKYYHPDASEWDVRVHPCRQAEDLDLDESKFIMMHRTLVPEGLNRELVFQSREHFYAFAEWYSGFRNSSMRSLFYPQAAGKNRRRSKQTS